MLMEVSHIKVPGIRNAGAINLESGVLPDSGEYAPEEAPRALVEALQRFRSRVLLN
jgi:hypothetical protein